MRRIDGTPYSDTLSGTTGNDLITGLAGNDFIDGGAGNDSLLGGDGDDTLDGNNGRDTLRGGFGNDVLHASDAGDYAYGDAGNDLLFIGRGAFGDGGSGNDTLIWDEAGNLAGTSLLGGSGNDLIHPDGGLGTSSGLWIDGGDGNDTIDTRSAFAATREATILGGRGNDLVTLADWNCQTDLGEGNDRLDLYGGAMASGSLHTGAGSDTIGLSVADAIGYAHVMDFTTGAGGDRIDLDRIFAGMEAAGWHHANPFTSGALQLVQQGGDTLLVSTVGGWHSLVSFNGTTATAFTADNFTAPGLSPAGDTAALVLAGLSRADSLTGHDGNDRLAGNAGNDTLDGGFGGDDSLSGGLGDDRLWGWSGNDTLDGGFGSDYASGGAGNDLIRGGAGDDSADGGDRYGSDRGRGLRGDAGNDTIDGGDGNDLIDGGDGNDSLLGSAGNDTLGGAAGNDTLRGGDGADFLSDASGRNRLYGDAGNDTIDARADASLADGGLGDDSLGYGGKGGTVFGGAGNDTLSPADNSAGSRALLIDGGDGDDLITTTGYNATLIDGTIRGGAGNDTVDLAAGVATVDMGNGDDLVILGNALHPDSITLGLGRDTLRIAGEVSWNGLAPHVVTDFRAGAGGDRIDLSGLNAIVGLAAGADPFSAGYLRLTDDGSATVLELDLFGGAFGAPNFRALVRLSGIGNPAALTADNFVQDVVPLVSHNARAPLAAVRSLTVAEDAGATALGLPAPIDPDGGDVTVRITASANGWFRTAAGDTVMNGDTLTAVQFAGLSYTPPADFNGDGGVLRYSVTDGEGSVTLGEVSITVTSVNDAPVVDDFTAGLVDDGQTLLDLQLFQHVRDADGETPDLTVTLADGGALPGWLHYDAATLSVTGTPPADSGGLVLRVTATDASGASDSGLVTLQPNPLLYVGGGGSDTLVGHSGDDTLQGAGGADVLKGGAGNDSLSGGTGADDFVFTSAIGTDTITDFTRGSDHVVIDASVWHVGNGDALIDGGRFIVGPGGFATSAELVIVGRDITGSVTDAGLAAAAIGSATSAYAVGDTRVFVTDTGGQSAIWAFHAADADAAVEANELSLIAVIANTGGTTLADYVFS